MNEAEMEFNPNETMIEIEVEEIMGGGGGGYDFYEGEYNLIPKIVSEEIKTKSKTMKENVTVAEIPFHEVSNETGKTAIIGGIL